VKADDYGFRNPNQQRPIFSDRNFLWVDELNFIFQGNLLLFLVVPHPRLGTTTKGEANTRKKKYKYRLCSAKFNDNQGMTLLRAKSNFCEYGSVRN
jgi:hypothetical protein